MTEIRNLTRNGETFYPLTHEKAVIGMDEFKETITEQVENYKPIEITGNVTNAPDEEDITSDSNNLLKFKNRNNLYGLGKVILRRGSSFASQVTLQNTIYIIQYNFDLGGARVNIPNGAILLFEGGTLSNGTLVCADQYDVRLVYYQDISVILNSVTLEGNFIYKACDKDTTGSISVDNSSIEMNSSNQLTVKAGGIQNTHLNGSVVDNSSIGLDTNNKISIKDGGVTGSKLNSGVVNTDDLSIVNNKIQLANRGTTDGMGKIILRKDQSFASQLTQTNTIYVIRYDFTLTGNVTVPANCILEFDGGSISDDGTHTLTGNNTLLSGDIKCLVTIAGTFANDYLDVIWFGAVGDDNTDCILVFRNISDVCIASGIDMYVPEGVYAFKTGNLHLSGQYNAGTDTSKYLDCKNITIRGDHRRSIVKQYTMGDIFNLSWIKNLTIKDMTIVNGVDFDDISDWPGGNNNISIIDCENIFIDGCWIKDSLWKMNLSGSAYYPDGGKGITLQGELFNNIRITNCDIENCFWGIDINTHPYFFTDKDSYVYVNNVLVRKCKTGVLYHAYDYNPSAIEAGLVRIQAKVDNCLQSCSFGYPTGLAANIDVVSTENVAALQIDGYGVDWNAQIPSASIVDDNVEAFVASIVSPKNCDINIHASCVQLNYGFILTPQTTRSGRVYEAKNNNILLDLGKNTEIVPITGHSEITTEAKFYLFNTLHYSGPYKNTVFIFNGLDIPIATITDNLLYNKSNNVVVCDGKIYTSEISASKIACINGIYNLAFAESKGGIWAFTTRYSSSDVYPAVGVMNNNSNLTFGISNNGEICKSGYTDSAIKNEVRGGNSITLRDMGGNYVGHIVANMGRTKGDSTQRPTLTADNSGFMYWDTTLRKPIWWNGTAWVDATGATV